MKKDGLLDNIYDIKDLYLVKFQEDYFNYLLHKDKITRIFHPDFYFIVERFKISSSEGKNNLEIYTESITCEDIYSREDQEEFKTIPPLFSEMFLVPREYYTDYEIKSGLVTSTRLFQIFQEYNLNHLDSIKVKTKGVKNARNY